MLKKLAMVAVMLPVFIMGISGVASAAMPSTNSANQTNGWAHFVVDSSSDGTVQLRFVSQRRFASCFEYRVDNEAANSATNYNTAVTDGLWDFKCVNNSETTVELEYCDLVEVRMVFGAEDDERFDWTSAELEPGQCEEPEQPEQPGVIVSNPLTQAPDAVSQPVADQVDKPTGGVNAGSGAVMVPLAALLTSAGAAVYGVVRIRKHGL